MKSSLPDYFHSESETSWVVFFQPWSSSSCSFSGYKGQDTADCLHPPLTTVTLPRGFYDTMWAAPLDCGIVCVLRKMSFYIPPMYIFNAPVSDLFLLAICATLYLGLGLTCSPQIHTHAMGNRIFYYFRFSQISCFTENQFDEPERAIVYL